MAKITDMFKQPKKRNLIILLIVIIIVALFIGFYLSRRSAADEGVTQLPAVPAGAKFTPGTKGLSKEYLQTLLQSEQQRAQQALRTGRSAVPTVIGTDTGVAPTGYTQQQLIACCYLLQQYCQRLGVGWSTPKGATDSLINQMQQSGGITPEVASQLKALSDQGASVDDYTAALNRLVKAGKLTPEQAKKLLAAYKKEHGVTAVTPEDALSQMANSGQISPDVASKLKSLDDQGTSADDYAAVLNNLVKEGKLTPAQRKKLLAAYKQKHQMRVSRAALADHLVDQLVGEGKLYPENAAVLKRLSAGNALPSKYAAALSQLVKAGKLTPEQAQRLLSSYLAQRGDAVPTTGDAKMDELKQSQEKQALQAEQEALSQAQVEQAAKSAEQQSKLQEEQQKQLAAAATAVKAQANKLFAAWNVVPQKMIRVKLSKQEEGAASGQEGASGTAGKVSTAQFPLIKAGTIMFGVLDTAVNSDRAGPVMATIVSGKFKGAKLMGSLSRTSDGQRVILRFNQFTMSDWPETISINAVAMNPDDAQIAIASSVDNHYLLRYGSLFGSSFLKGYSEAITNAGQTTLGLGVIQTTHPKLSARDRTLVGLGEVGKNLGDVTRQIFNTPPTVRVNAGVGIGLLFMSDVSRQGVVTTAATEPTKAAEKTTVTTKATSQQEPPSSRLSSITESRLRRLQKPETE
jgi:polyhydroxyalkanoate synthesis regulator phasin